MWDSLENGLQSLLSEFASCEEELWKYQQRFNVFLWSGHFSNSFNGGPVLSPTILKALGDFGVELILETYFSEEPHVE